MAEEDRATAEQLYREMDMSSSLDKVEATTSLSRRAYRPTWAERETNLR